MPDLIPEFLEKYSSKTNKTFHVPLPFQWTVSITEDEKLYGAIDEVLKDVDLNKWKTFKSEKWRSDGDAGNILVAQEVSIPSESFQAVVLGHPNRGGFMPGYGVAERTDFLSRNLVINFLETGIDIETQLFRPWTIALGSAGLLNTKLRANINVREYNRDLSLRKSYKFTNVFPTNCEGYTLTYSDKEFIIKSVTFGYSKYELEVDS